MKRVAVVVLMLFAPIIRGETVDETVKRTFVFATKVFDNPTLSNRAYEQAFATCNYNTNAYIRILTELAVTNDVGVSECAFYALGGLDGGDQLAFLYSCASNSLYSANAVSAILRLQGCTPSSIALFESFLANTNYDAGVRSDFCGDIFRHAYKNSIDATNRLLATECALRFAATDTRRIRTLDRTMVLSDPTYEFSKRRLSVLRSVRDQGSNPYQMLYVTNAINEMVSYPEDDLPD